MSKKFPKNIHVIIGLFSLILLLYPGQNRIQIHKLEYGNQKIKGVMDVANYAPLPQKNKNDPGPIISAKSAIIIDVGSASILYEKNSSEKLSPASTTKIMTAIVALEEYEENDPITIKNENKSIGNKSKLISGETLLVSDVVAAMLISSGNDAALALGQHHGDGYGGFIKKMNQKATDYHLENTQFSNVSGLEQSTHFTTAKDLAILTKEAMKVDKIKKYVGTKSMNISSVDGKYTHLIENTNKLLGVVDGVRGVKTGWTNFAGECLVTSTIRNDHEIVIVVLGSEDRFGESTKLIEWTYKNHIWENFPKMDISKY